MYKIYSKQNCSYCFAAKNLLASKNIPFVECEIGKDITKEMLLEILPGARSVPQIFLLTSDGEKYVGGYSELVNNLKENDNASGSNVFLSE
jgi:glutaredoxin 3